MCTYNLESEEYLSTTPELMEYYTPEPLLQKKLLLSLSYPCDYTYFSGSNVSNIDLRLSPIILPLQLLLNVLFTIFYYLPLKDSSPYNSSPTIPPYIFPLYTITH